MQLYRLVRTPLKILDLVCAFTVASKQPWRTSSRSWYATPRRRAVQLRDVP